MTFACAVEDVPLGEGRTITLDGRRVALFRTAVGWYALDAVCPHRGGPLADGIVCEHLVICPLHERRFALETGAALNDGDGVECHSVEVRGHRVFVEVGAVASVAA